jgi:adenine/guanine phosphoribosyltransferase-like PRPP-binding protein
LVLTEAKLISTIYIMNQTTFPEQSRKMTDEEAENYFLIMLDQIKEFNPNEIVAVARSGFSYAMWAAQELRLPLGAYWHERAELVTGSDPERIIFVDDNILTGNSYKDTKLFMTRYYPDCEWRWAVLFSDWNTPEDVRNEIIQGVRLPYFAMEPIWGSRKISKNYGVRYRDE